jgi:hypothetical protein
VRRRGLLALAALLLPTACSSEPAAVQLDRLDTEDLRRAGLYQLCDPQERSIDTSRLPVALAEALGAEIEDVTVAALFRGWGEPASAEADILAFLAVPDDTAYPYPIFDLDRPLDVVARIRYRGGPKASLPPRTARPAFPSPAAQPGTCSGKIVSPYPDPRSLLCPKTAPLP